jgi:ABC-type glycerol-3-phosphate transport system substrate-binding protein
MNVRSIILACVLGLPAAGLLALGPRGAREAPPGQVVVRYWEKWAGVEALAIRDIVDEFNAAEGRRRGIWIDLHNVSNVDERMLIATAGGDPPDIAGLYDRYIPQFAAQGALLDLTDLLEPAGIRMEAMKPIWRDVGEFEGRIYGLPCAPSMVGLFYNRELFRAAGLDPDRPPETIEELDEYARRLTKRNPKGEIIQLGFTAWPGMLGWWHWSWPYFFDARLWDGEHFHLDTPEGRAALTWLARQRAEFGVKDLLNFETSNLPIEGPDNPFLSGKLAMVMQGPWMTNWIAKYRPALDYGVARFPSASPRRRHALASADVLVIPATAQRPREAMIFLAYLMRPQTQEALALAHGKLSPYQRPSERFFARHPNPHVRTFEGLAESPDAFRNPKMPTFGEAWTEMLFMVENVLRGLQTPAEAAATTQAKVDRVVADHAHMRALRGAQTARRK